jgi:hypothetical protein
MNVKQNISAVIEQNTPSQQQLLDVFFQPHDASIQAFFIPYAAKQR